MRARTHTDVCVCVCVGGGVTITMDFSSAIFVTQNAENKTNAILCSSKVQPAKTSMDYLGAGESIIPFSIWLQFEWTKLLFKIQAYNKTSITHFRFRDFPNSTPKLRS